MKHYRYIVGAVLIFGILLVAKSFSTVPSINEEVDRILDLSEKDQDESGADSIALEETTAQLTAEMTAEPAAGAEPTEATQQVAEAEQMEEKQAAGKPQPLEEAVAEKEQAEQPKGEEVALGKTTEETEDLITHRVSKGESLFLISRKYGITVDELRQLNNLTSDEIRVGQVLSLPAKVSSQQPARSMAARGAVKQNPDLNEDNLYWLAKIIHAEARGESYEGQVAVGAVVLDRVRHENFPDTIYGVIFDKWEGKYYQFSPVLDGTINLEPNQTAYQAARDALSGRDPSGGALYFYNPETSTNKWIYHRPIIKQIGKHVFAL